MMLYIDDNPDEHLWLKAVTGSNDIDSAYCGAEALTKKKVYSCIVLDYSVIRDYGGDLYRKIKKRFKCPVIVTSSFFPVLKIELDKGDSLVGKQELPEYLRDHACCLKLA